MAKTIRKTDSAAGFTLVEMMISVLVLGVVLIAMAGVFTLFQKSSAQTNDYADAQQNARIALDFITNHLRQAGSSTDYFRGQRRVVHAGPYQAAINADIDNQQTIDGMSPLTALRRAFSPNRVPPSGTPIYSPATDYQSNAETIVLTLDSNSDGVISGADRGDDPEESSRNTNLFMLKKVVYGYGEGSNEVRESNLALIRGPNQAATWTIPPPLFQYWYDHDNDPATGDRLWGDNNFNGVLDTGEITAITPMPTNSFGQFDKAREHSRKALSLAPDEVDALIWAGDVELYAGELAEARLYYERARKLCAEEAPGIACIVTSSCLGYIYSREDRPEEAQATFGQALELGLRLVESGDESRQLPYYMACINAVLGRNEQAHSWLSRAVEAGWRDYRLAALDPLLAGIRGDEQFKITMATVRGMIDQMRRHPGKEQ